MSSKPVLYYALISGYSVWEYPIMKVTSESKSQVYGSVDNEPSHRRKSDVKAKFASYDEAVARRDGVKAIIEKYAPLHSELSKQMNALHAKEYKEIEDFLNERG